MKSRFRKSVKFLMKCYPIEKLFLIIHSFYNLIRYQSYDPKVYYILEKEKIAYINNAKVACSSIKCSLCIKQGIFETIPEGYLAYKPYFAQLKQTKKINNDYFVFTFVRNPFARFVSCYNNKIVNPKKVGRNFPYRHYFFFIKPFHILSYEMPFEKFVSRIASIPDCLSDRHFKSQYDTIKPDKSKVDFVGKLESYSDDFSVLAKNFNLEPQIANKQKSKKEDFRDFYTIETAEIIYQRYKKDFDLWYPKAYDELIDYIKNKPKK